MADNVIVPQSLARTGLIPIYAAVATTDTHLVSNDGKMFLHFKKTGAGNCDVTFVSAIMADGLTVSDLIVQVLATTGDKMVGPFNRNTFNNTGNQVQFTVSESTGLVCAAIQMP